MVDWIDGTILFGIGLGMGSLNEPAFCKGIGDLCDADGFVKPEYPYYKAN